MMFALVGKAVRKKDEKNLVLFDFTIKLLYGRYPKRGLVLFKRFKYLFAVLTDGALKVIDAMH